MVHISFWLMPMMLIYWEEVYIIGRGIQSITQQVFLKMFNRG